MNPENPDPAETCRMPARLGNGEFLRELTETMQSALVIAREDGTIFAVNQAMLRIFEYEWSEVKGQNVRMLMPSPDRNKHDDYLASYLSTGRRKIMGLGRFLMAEKKSGLKFPIDLHLGEFDEGHDHFFFALIYDLSVEEDRRTKLDNLREEIAHAFRMGSMGLLANAIAHEINQPLTTIRNYVETVEHLAKGSKPVDPVQLREAMSACSHEADRAAQIIRRLRQFLTRGESDLNRHSLQKLVDRALSLALADISDHAVSVSVDIDPIADQVLVDGVQIEQVLFNLLRNAFQAMKYAGPLNVRILGVPEPAMTEVIVEDSGPGLEESQQLQLFTPFNGTKPDGMGVGLSICRAIVEGHSGELWVTTSEMGGVAFHFTVPRIISKDEAR